MRRYYNNNSFLNHIVMMIILLLLSLLSISVPVLSQKLLDAKGDDILRSKRIFNTSILVTMNVEPHGDVFDDDDCTDERLALEQNITTTNMTMIMMDMIGNIIPNQTVYIEEFDDYYKCPTYSCDYGKRCSIYCSEIVILFVDKSSSSTTTSNGNYVWRNLSSNTFDNIKIAILNDHRKLIKKGIIKCNGRADNFMMQYFVSKPLTRHVN